MRIVLVRGLRTLAIITVRQHLHLMQRNAARKSADGLVAQLPNHTMYIPQEDIYRKLTNVTQKSVPQNGRGCMHQYEVMRFISVCAISVYLVKYRYLKIGTSLSDAEKR